MGIYRYKDTPHYYLLIREFYADRNILYGVFCYIGKERDISKKLFAKTLETKCWTKIY